MGLVPICWKLSDKFTIITINNDLVRWFLECATTIGLLSVFYQFCLNSLLTLVTLWHYTLCTIQARNQTILRYGNSFTRNSPSLLNIRHSRGVFGNDKPQFSNEKWLQLILQFRIYLFNWQTKVVHHKMLY